MDDLQNQHVTRLNTVFTSLNRHKYEAGAKEHGGYLFEIDILPQLHNIRDEIMDAFNYVQSAIDAIEGKFPSETAKHGN